MNVAERYSYSKLSTFEQCPYKYKLAYVDKHEIRSDSIATEVGTAIHATEESIGKSLMRHESPDYNALSSSIWALMASLKERYPNDFFLPDKSGRTYQQKVEGYLASGIHRLEGRLKANPSLEIVGLEKEFEVSANGHTFHGFIDRVLHDKSDGSYIIEDIKTYPKPIEQKNLHTPLQHVIYTLALMQEVDGGIRCAYDLPFCNLIQDVEEGYLGRGLNELGRLFGELGRTDFHPNPSPLCHWCVFSGTYPDQPEEARGLCPFHSLWTRQNKTKEVNERWEGRLPDATQPKNPC